MLTPLITAIRSGSLAGFDAALANAEPELVHRRIYLTLERTRDICMRNLFRKVILSAGWEETKDATTGEVTSKLRRSRIRIEEFEAAMRVGYHGSSDAMIDRDEVECFLANMIYKVRLPFLCLARVVLITIARPEHMVSPWSLSIHAPRLPNEFVPGLDAWAGLFPQPSPDHINLASKTKRKRQELILGGSLQNMMKGYIARDRGIVVLSKAGAFPGTGV